MAWSTSAGPANHGWIDGAYQFVWNDVVSTVTAVTTDTNQMKFYCTVTSSACWSTGDNPTLSDRIYYGGEWHTVYGPYGADNHAFYFYIPLDYISSSISLDIGYNSWTATLNSGAYIGNSSLSVSDGYFGSEIITSINRIASSATHTLTVSCGGNEETLLSNSSELSATWTPAVSTYAPLITGASSATATFSLTTYINGNTVGTVASTITVTFKRDDVKPSTVITVTDAKGYKDTYGKYVAAQSQFYVSLSHTLQYGASAASVSIKYNGTTYTDNPCTTSVVNASATTVTATVTDSRGFTSDEVTYTAEIYSYTGPTESITALYHSDVDGTENEAGLYLAANIEGNFTSLDSQNSVTIAAYVKTASESNYTEAGYVTNKTVTVLNLDGTALIYSPDTTYDLMFIITDEFGSSNTVYQRLASRKWAMKFRPDGNGVAFGKAAEYDNTLQIPSDWDMKRGENLWPFPVGSIYMSVNDTDPSTLFGGTWERLKDRFLLGAGDEYTAGTKDGEATHTLTIDEMPSHSHGIRAEYGTNANLYTAPPGQYNQLTNNTGYAYQSAYCETVGGDEPHNNMPPYLVVYMWKRTA